MPDYNGYKSWNQWNVSLHINNDEELYAAAMNIAARYPRARDSAARHMLGWLKDTGRTHTSDGAPYSLEGVKAAMVGMAPAKSTNA